MGTGRTFNKQPVSRPKKGLRERRRRENVQKKRLVGFGLDEAVVAKMSSRELKDLLKRPAKIMAPATA